MSSFISLVFCSNKRIFFILIKLPALYGHPVNTETLYGPFSVRINGFWLPFRVTLPFESWGSTYTVHMHVCTVTEIVLTTTIKFLLTNCRSRGFTIYLSSSVYINKLFKINFNTSKWKSLLCLADCMGGGSKACRKTTLSPFKWRCARYPVQNKLWIETVMMLKKRKSNVHWWK